MKSAIGIALSFVGLGYVLSGQQADDAAGKTFERVCGNCHDSATATGERHTRREWQGVVEDMTSRGATGTDTELRDIVSWLTRHCGNIRINQLSAKDLHDEMELSQADAETIVAYRTKQGKFADFDALKKAGVDASKFELYKDSIVY
jgi:Helix-hairpin-helix motif